MRQKVPWSSDDIDPDAREAAKEAARRAGMSLGEWLNATISERATKFGVDSREHDLSGEAPRATRPSTRSVQRTDTRRDARLEINETLDEVSNRLNRLTRSKASTSSVAPQPTRRSATSTRSVDMQTDAYQADPYSDVEAIVSAAAAESERRMREGTVKTASALDSVVKWIERADERWGEATRQTHEKMSRSDQRWEETLKRLQDRIEITDRNAGDAFRMTAEKLDKSDQRWAETSRQTLEQQERQSEIFNKAFGLMTRRLDDIEKRLTEGQQPALKPVWTAMERIEKQLAGLNRQDLQKTDEGRAQLERFENTLMSFEKRLGDIAERITQTPPPAPKRSLRIEQLSNAVADIKAFQEQPLTVEGRLLRQASAAPSAVAASLSQAVQSNHHAQEEILRGLKFDIAKLATRLDTLNQEPAMQDVSVPLMRELSQLHDRMQGLASRETVNGLEEAVRELGLRLINSRLEGVSQFVVEPVERLYGEVRKLAQSLGANGESDLARDVSTIAKSVEALGADRFDPQSLVDLTGEVASIKEMVKHYDQTNGLKVLTDQIGDLSERMSHIGNRHVDADAFAELKASIEDIRAGLKYKPASRSGKDASAGVPDIIAMFGQQLDGLAAKIDMLATRTPDDTATQVLSARIEQLSQKIDTHPRTLSTRFEELTNRLSDQLQADQQFDVLAAKIEQLALNASDDSSSQALSTLIEQLVQKVDAQPDALSKRFEELTNRLSDQLQTNQQFDVLAAKIEQLALRAPDDNNAQTLSILLEQLAQKVDAQPDALSKRFEELTNRLSDQLQDFSQVRTPSVEGSDHISSRLDAFSSHLDQNSKTLASQLEERFEAKLDSKLEALAARLNSGPITVAAQLDALATRLDSSPLELVDRINALTAQLSTTPQDVLSRLDALAARLEQGSSADVFSHDVVSRLDDLTSRISAQPDDLIERIEQLSQRMEKSQAQNSSRDDSELHQLLKALVQKIDDTQKADTATTSLDALEQQIRVLAQKLEQGSPVAPVSSSQMSDSDVFRSLEHSMQDLASRIDTLRSETLVVSEQAAERAVNNALSLQEKALERSNSTPHIHQAEPETNHALLVVHDTLDKVMNRLEQLETGNLTQKPISVSQPVNSAVSVALPKKQNAFGFSPLENTSGHRQALTEQQHLTSIEDALGALPATHHDITESGLPEPGLRAQRHVVQSHDLDEPLDPDAPVEPRANRDLNASSASQTSNDTRMDLNDAMKRNPDSQDVKAHFIAAARRAAQAAAVEMNATSNSQASKLGKSTSAVAQKLAARLASRQEKIIDVKKLNLNDLGDSEIKLPAGEASLSFLEKLKSTVETRRRPLLLGLAAILLALGASQVIGNLSKDPSDTNIAINPAVQLDSQGNEILTGGTVNPQSVQTPEPAKALDGVNVPAKIIEAPATVPSVPNEKRSQAPVVSQPSSQSIASAFSPTPVQQQKAELHQQKEVNASLSSSAPVSQVSPSQKNAKQNTPADASKLAPLTQANPDITGGIAPQAVTGSASPVVGNNLPSAPAKTQSVELPRLKNVKGLSSLLASLPANTGTSALRKAALDGDPVAIYDMASRLAEGRGAPRDLSLSAKLFERVAEADIAPAQYRIGNMHEKGLGVNRDAQLARQWYTRAAENGNAKAMHNLAVIIAEGAGSKPDYTSAVKWFEKAADYGVRDSQYNLAILMARGLGTTQNLQKSYVWFAVAGAQGDADALKKRDEVGARLSPAELATALLEVQKFKPATLVPLANEMSAADRYDDKPAAKTPKNVRS